MGPRRSVQAAVLLVCLSSGVGALLAISTAGAHRHISADLIIPPKSLHLGEIWAQPEFQWTIPLTNATDQDITILEIGASCQCTSIDPSSLTIPARKTAAIDVTFDLSLSDPTLTHAQSHNFAVQLSVAVDRPDSAPFTWELTGRVRNPLSLSAREVVFGESDHAFLPERVIRPATVHFDAPVDLGAVAANVDTDCVSVSTKLETARTGTVTIVPRDGLAEGRFQCEVHITPQTRAGVKLPVVSIPVRATVVGEIQVVPSEVSFLPAPIGSQHKTTVILTSRTGRSVLVRNIQSSSDALLAEPKVVDAVNGAAFRISQYISKQGNQEETLEFDAVTPDGKSHTVKLVVNSVGQKNGAIP